MSYFNTLLSNSNHGIFVIAEACDNHMGSLDMAKALVNMAVSAGASAVKFQHHIVEEEMLLNELTSDNFTEPLSDFLLRNALTLSDHIKLKEYCDLKGIVYLCTPFSYAAAVQIDNLVPFFKIGSGEFQDFWFIEKLGKLGKPILLSTGMCSYDEISSTFSHYKSLGLDIALLNCLSEYPPTYEDMNLKVITNMIRDFDCVVGHSDHTPDIYTAIAAVSLGARIIEKHITLSSFIDGPDKSVSINESQLKDLVRAVNCVNSALGSDKVLNSREKDIRSWAYRSVVSACEINAGELITFDKIKTKRPGTGLPSREYKLIIGKRAKNTIPDNTMIDVSDVK